MGLFRGDDRPHIQLRVTKREFTQLLREARPLDVGLPFFCETQGEQEWSEEDEIIRRGVKRLAPELASEIGKDPAIFDLVVIEPAWLIATGEVRRWTREPLPKETA